MPKLAEEGLLNLEDQWPQWLPSYPNIDIDSTITIRPLPGHTNGIFDYLNNGDAGTDALFNDLDRLRTPE